MYRCCSFFGEIKVDDITPEMACEIYDFFEYLIIYKNVDIFFSASESDFDLFCEGMLFAIKKRFSKIKIIKFADRNYKNTFEDLKYQHVITYQSTNYIKRCKDMARISDYVLLDSLCDSKIGFEIALVACFCKSNTKVYDLNLIMKRAAKLLSAD